MNTDPIVYFDCTSTIISELNTGIQKVVRSLLEQVSIFEKELGLQFIPICHKFGHHYLLKDVEKMTEKTYKNYNKVMISGNDYYFCADAYWADGMIGWIPSFKKFGVKIITFCYDLIPIYYPEFISNSSRLNFQNALDRIIESSDLILCISEKTKRDLNKYINSSNFNNDPIVRSFKLSPINSSFKNKSIKYDHKKDNFILSVGTIEPRRGYLQLFKEFKIAWDKGYSDSLFIVGKKEENSSKILEQANILISDGYPLKIMHNISDEELHVLYKTTKCCIISSLAEGYGLPLAEAIIYNKPILANRLEVFGEFAGNYPIYFNIGNLGELSNLLIHFDSLVWFKDTPRFPSYAETAKEIAEIILENFDQELSQKNIYSDQLTKEKIIWTYRIYYNCRPSEEDIKYWIDRCETFHEFKDSLDKLK